MKKWTTIVLMLVLTLISIGAHAETYADMSEVIIRNTYTNANPDSRSPEETFAFTIQARSVTDAAQGVTAENMPIPTVGSVHYAAGEAGSSELMKEIRINLPEYPSVGIYTYSIRGVAGTNAGVDYNTDEIRLVVTVIEQNGKIRVAAVHTETAGAPLGGGKSDTITSVYSAGKLAVSKAVTGNLGDKSRYFDIHVTLTGEEGKTYAEAYPVTGGSHADNPTQIAIGEETTFHIRDDETITVSNLPYGVTYTVTETDYSADGYETSITCSDENQVVNSASDTVSVTNHKESAIDTGIVTDSLPYIVVLIVVAAAAAVLLIRRRSRKE